MVTVMKNFILGIMVGAIILIAVIWHFSGKQSHDEVKQDLQNAAAHAAQAVEEKLGTSNLSAAEIKDELARTGKVVRRKAEDAGAAIADAATDARVTATIKARLLKDGDLSTLKISVSTANGLVTLSGTASSPENIKKAIQLALETDGVHKVVSTIQVKN
jgi:osmotically-inducible protein OsmY